MLVSYNVCMEVQQLIKSTLTQDERKEFMDTLKSFMVGDLEVSHKIFSSGVASKGQT